MDSPQDTFDTPDQEWRGNTVASHGEVRGAAWGGNLHLGSGGESPVDCVREATEQAWYQGS